MPAKTAIGGLAGSVLLATLAFAQTPTATSNRADATSSIAADLSPSFQGDWGASKLVGIAVYNDNDESLGSIDDLLTDKNGSIKAVVIGIGGLLGVGAHLVAVPFDKVRFVNERIPYNVAAGSPNAARSETPSTTTTGANTAPAATSKPDPGSPDHAVFSATKDELKAMPEFKYST